MVIFLTEKDIETVVVFVFRLISEFIWKNYKCCKTMI